MTDIKIHRPHIQQHSNQPKKVENTDKYIPKEMKNFATAQEAMFAELMFKEMNKTSAESVGGTANNFYNSMLVTERANALAQKSKNGIKDMILNEIYPKKFRNKENYAAYSKQQHKFQTHKIAMHDQPSLPAVSIADKSPGVSHE